MKARFTVDVEIDPGIIELVAKHRGRPIPVTTEEITGDLECRLSDALRWRDGVQRVDVRVLPRLELVR